MGQNLPDLKEKKNSKNRGEKSRGDRKTVEPADQGREKHNQTSGEKGHSSLQQELHEIHHGIFHIESAVNAVGIDEEAKKTDYGNA